MIGMCAVFHRWIFGKIRFTYLTTGGKQIVMFLPLEKRKPSVIELRFLDLIRTGFKNSINSQKYNPWKIVRDRDFIFYIVQLGNYKL